MTTVFLRLVWLLSLFFILFWRCNFLATSSVSMHLTPTKTSARGCFQESDTPIALSLGGTTIVVTPSAAMTPPAAAVPADIDCEGSWECLAGTVRHRQSRLGLHPFSGLANDVSKAT